MPNCTLLCRGVTINISQLKMISQIRPEPGESWSNNIFLLITEKGMINGVKNCTKVKEHKQGDSTLIKGRSFATLTSAISLYPLWLITVESGSCKRVDF